MTFADESADGTADFVAETGPFCVQILRSRGMGVEGKNALECSVLEKGIALEGLGPGLEVGPALGVGVLGSETYVLFQAHDQLFPIQPYRSCNRSNAGEAKIIRALILHTPAYLQKKIVKTARPG